VIGTNARQRAESSTSALHLQTVSVKPATIRSLGVAIDSTLSFDEHVDNVCKFYFHLRALRHTRTHISEDTAKLIACSMIHGRLHCNSVLYGTLAANLNKLRRVQNSAARIVTRTRRTDHATPILADQSSTEYSARSQSLQDFDHASGSMYRHVIYVPATETYYRRTASTSSSLIARSLKPHPQCRTIYRSMPSQTFPI